MLCAFSVGFLESFKSCLLFLVALPCLIDTLAPLLAWRSLLWLSTTWRRRYLTQNHFLQYNIAGLIFGITFIVLISQEKSLRWKQINTHTHTHTHTYTISITWWNSPCRGKGTYPLRSFNKVHQRGELNWASQLQRLGSTELLNCYVKIWVNTN